MIGNFPIVSIVMPVFNEEKNLAACLDSVLNLEYPDDKLEIILVDNGSTDNSRLIANNYQITLLERPDVKVGAVRNFGVEHSKGDIIVFLDADCLVEPWWLKEGVRLIEEEKNNAVGGLFLLRENPSWIEKNWILNSSRSYSYQNTFIGACIFIEKEAFKSVGGFNEKLNAGEDCFLTNALVDKGCKIKIDPNLSVVHLGYPNTISGFLRRQIWHSADSFKRLSNILSDMTLLLVVLFTFSFLLLIASLFFENRLLSLLLIGVLVFIPAVFSLKRISRYGGLKNKFRFVSVYIVDVFYVVGRVIGLLYGILNILISRYNTKIYK